MVHKNQTFRKLVYPPSFEKGAVVVLEKNCIGYRPNSKWSNVTDPFFKKSCLFVVFDCGDSIYNTNEEGECTNPVDDVK